MSVPGIGPIISSAMVAAIDTGATFSKGRDFGWRQSKCLRETAPFLVRSRGAAIAT